MTGKINKEKKKKVQSDKNKGGYSGMPMISGKEKRGDRPMTIDNADDADDTMECMVNMMIDSDDVVNGSSCLQPKLTRTSGPCA